MGYGPLCKLSDIFLRDRGLIAWIVDRGRTHKKTGAQTVAAMLLRCHCWYTRDGDGTQLLPHRVSTPPPAYCHHTHMIPLELMYCSPAAMSRASCSTHCSRRLGHATSMSLRQSKRDRSASHNSCRHARIAHLIILLFRELLGMVQSFMAEELQMAKDTICMQ